MFYCCGDQGGNIQNLFGVKPEDLMFDLYKVVTVISE
jgi:hypothetical protein